MLSLNVDGKDGHDSILNQYGLTPAHSQQVFKSCINFDH